MNLIQSKEHLSPEGLRKIIAIKASMNSGGGGWRLSLYNELQVASPNITLLDRPFISENPKILDSNWLAGFTSA